MSSVKRQPAACTNRQAGRIAVGVVIFLFVLLFLMSLVDQTASGQDGTIPPRMPTPEATSMPFPTPTIVLNPVVCAASPNLDICIPVPPISPRVRLPLVIKGK